MVQIAIWTFWRAIPHSPKLDNLFSRHQRDREYKHLQLRYLYLEGRYFIRSGGIKRGSWYPKVISYARELKQSDFLLEGYRQIILLLHSNRKISLEMAYYTDLALEDAIQASNP